MAFLTDIFGPGPPRDPDDPSFIDCGIDPDATFAEKTCTIFEAAADGNGHGEFLCQCGNVIRQCRCKHTPDNPRRVYQITDEKCGKCG